MITPTNIQTILDKNGIPEYIVIPYDQFIKLSETAYNKTTVPQEVVEIMVEKDVTLICAWREYLGFSQEEVARRMNIAQPTYSKIESSKRHRKDTIKRVAAALGISPAQIH